MVSLASAAVVENPDHVPGVRYLYLRKVIHDKAFALREVAVVDWRGDPVPIAGAMSSDADVQAGGNLAALHDGDAATEGGDTVGRGVQWLRFDLGDPWALLGAREPDGTTYTHRELFYHHRVSEVVLTLSAAHDLEGVFLQLVAKDGAVMEEFLVPSHLADTTHTFRTAGPKRKPKAAAHPKYCGFFVAAEVWMLPIRHMWVVATNGQNMALDANIVVGAHYGNYELAFDSTSHTTGEATAAHQSKAIMVVARMHKNGAGTRVARRIVLKISNNAAAGGAFLFLLDADHRLIFESGVSTFLDATHFVSSPSTATWGSVPCIDVTSPVRCSAGGWLWQGMKKQPVGAEPWIAEVGTRNAAKAYNPRSVTQNRASPGTNHYNLDRAWDGSESTDCRLGIKSKGQNCIWVRSSAVAGSELRYLRFIAGRSSSLPLRGSQVSITAWDDAVQRKYVLPAENPGTKALLDDVDFDYAPSLFLPPPTKTPSLSLTHSSTASPTLQPSVTASVSLTLTDAVTRSHPSGSRTVSRAVTLTSTYVLTATPSSSLALSATATAAASMSVTGSVSAVPSRTATAAPTTTLSLTPTATRPATPTRRVVYSPTVTAGGRVLRPVTTAAEAAGPASWDDDTERLQGSGTRAAVAVPSAGSSVAAMCTGAGAIVHSAVRADGGAWAAGPQFTNNATFAALVPPGSFVSLPLVRPRPLLPLAACPCGGAGAESAAVPPSPAGPDAALEVRVTARAVFAGGRDSDATPVQSALFARPLLLRTAIVAGTASWHGAVVCAGAFPCTAVFSSAPVAGTGAVPLPLLGLAAAGARTASLHVLASFGPQLPVPALGGAAAAVSFAAAPVQVVVPVASAIAVTGHPAAVTPGRRYDVTAAVVPRDVSDTSAAAAARGDGRRLEGQQAELVATVVGAPGGHAALTWPAAVPYQRLGLRATASPVGDLSPCAADSLPSGSFVVARAALHGGVAVFRQVLLLHTNGTLPDGGAPTLALRLTVRAAAPITGAPVPRRTAEVPVDHAPPGNGTAPPSPATPAAILNTSNAFAPAPGPCPAPAPGRNISGRAVTGWASVLAALDASTDAAAEARLRQRAGPGSSASLSGPRVTSVSGCAVAAYPSTGYCGAAASITVVGHGLAALGGTELQLRNATPTAAGKHEHGPWHGTGAACSVTTSGAVVCGSAFGSVKPGLRVEATVGNASGASAAVVGHGTVHYPRPGEVWCRAGFYSPACLECPTRVCGTPCSGHGSCDDTAQGTGACSCAADAVAGFWAGVACGECAAGYHGPACAAACPGTGAAGGPCGFNGRCLDGRGGNGTCVCSVGFRGALCDACQPGFYGPYCTACPGRTAGGMVCSGHGTCEDGAGGSGRCACAGAYSGPGCSFPCLGGGCGRGACAAGGCACEPGWTVAAATGRCEQCLPLHYGSGCARCPDCGGHGACRDTAGGDGGCTCAAGYWGAACDRRCPNGGCGGHGRCQQHSGECLCDDDAAAGRWGGPGCSRCLAAFNSSGCRTACPAAVATASLQAAAVAQLAHPAEVLQPCGGHGVCSDGACAACHDEPAAAEGAAALPRCGAGCGLVGAQCADPGCPAAQCSGHGVCTFGRRCVCDAGWGGGRCGTVLSCVPACGPTAACVLLGAATACRCLAGYHSAPGCTGVCPGTAFGADGAASAVCSGHGVCGAGGECFCFAPYVGAACDLRCPRGPDAGGADAACSGRGRCSGATGRCVCDTFFGGAACGQCVAGRAGARCETPCRNGFSDGRACVCLAGFAGPECATECPKAGGGGAHCGGHGRCHDGASGNGTCGCEAGWHSAGCAVFCTPGHCRAALGLEHAACTADGRCACVADGVRFYAGPQCADCARGFWGAQCNLPCACSGHGACGRSDGGCHCDQDAAAGFWGSAPGGTAPCGVCSAGYVGPRCTARVVDFTWPAGKEAVVPDAALGQEAARPEAPWPLHVSADGKWVYTGPGPVFALRVAAGPASLLPGGHDQTTSAALSERSLSYGGVVGAASVCGAHATATGFSDGPGTTLSVTCSDGARVSVPAIGPSGTRGSVSVRAASAAASSTDVSFFDAATGAFVSQASGAVRLRRPADVTALNILGPLLRPPFSSANATLSLRDVTVAVSLGRAAVAATVVSSTGATSPLLAVLEIAAATAVVLTAGLGGSPLKLRAHTVAAATGAVTEHPPPAATEDTTSVLLAATAALRCATAGPTLHCVTVRGLGGGASVDAVRVDVGPPGGGSPATVAAEAVATIAAVPPASARGVVTALAVDVQGGLVLAAMTLGASAPSTLVKWSAARLVVSGQQALARVAAAAGGMEPEVVRHIAVDGARREAWLVVATGARRVAVRSLNLFGVRRVLPAVVDAASPAGTPRTVALEGEGFTAGRLFVCHLGAGSGEAGAGAGVAATVVDSETLRCPVRAAVPTDTPCAAVLPAVRLGTNRTSAPRSAVTSTLRLLRPSSAAVTTAAAPGAVGSGAAVPAAPGGGVGAGNVSAAVPWRVVVAGGPFYAEAVAHSRCRLVDAGGTVALSTAVALLGSRRAECLFPPLLGPTRPPSAVQFSHDGGVFGSAAAPFAVVGGPAGLVAVVASSVPVVLEAAETVALPPVSVALADTQGNSLAGLVAAASDVSVAGELRGDDGRAAGAVAARSTVRGAVVFSDAVARSPGLGALRAVFRSHGGAFVGVLTLRVVAGRPRRLVLLSNASGWRFGAASSAALVPYPVVGVADGAGNVIAVPGGPGFPPQVSMTFLRVRDPAPTAAVGYAVAGDNYTVHAVEVRRGAAFRFGAVSARGAHGVQYAVTFAPLYSDGQRPAAAVTAVTVVVGVARCGAAERAVAGTTQCERCPAHTVCDGGTAVRSEPGYWRGSQQATTLHECEGHAECHDDGVQEQTACGPGYEGLLCSVCAAGHARALSGRCDECPASRGLSGTLAILTVAVAMAALFGFVELSVRTGKAVLISLVRIAVTYVQLLATAVLSSGSMPDTTRTLLDVMNIAASLDLPTFYLRCAGFLPPVDVPASGLSFDASGDGGGRGDTDTFYSTYLFMALLLPCAVALYAVANAVLVVWGAVAAVGAEDEARFDAVVHAREVAPPATEEHQRRRRTSIMMAGLSDGPRTAPQETSSATDSRRVTQMAASRVAHGGYRPVGFRAGRRRSGGLATSGSDVALPADDVFAYSLTASSAAVTPISIAGRTPMAAARGALGDHISVDPHPSTGTSHSGGAHAAASARRQLESYTFALEAHDSLVPPAALRTLPDADDTGSDASLFDAPRLRQDVTMTPGEAPQFIPPTPEPLFVARNDDVSMPALPPSLGSSGPHVFPSTTPPPGAIPPREVPRHGSAESTPHRLTTGRPSPLAVSLGSLRGPGITAAPPQTLSPTVDFATARSAAKPPRRSRRSTNSHRPVAPPDQENHVAALILRWQQQHRAAKEESRRQERRDRLSGSGGGLWRRLSSVFRGVTPTPTAARGAPPCPAHGHVQPDPSKFGPRSVLSRLPLRRLFVVWLERCVAAFFVLAFVLYPTVMKYAGRLLVCEDVDHGPVLGQRSVLAAGRELLCAHPAAEGGGRVAQYAGYRSVALVTLTAFGVGFPVVAMGLVRVFAALTTDPFRTARMFQFVLGGYHGRYWFWEAVMLARKAMIAFASFGISDDGGAAGSSAPLRSYVMMWTIAAGFVLDVLCVPFRNRSQQRLDALAMAAIAASISLVQVSNAVGGRWGSALVAGVVAINAVTLLFAAGCIAAAVRTALREAGRWPAWLEHALDVVASRASYAVGGGGGGTLSHLSEEDALLLRRRLRAAHPRLAVVLGVVEFAGAAPLPQESAVGPEEARPVAAALGPRVLAEVPAVNSAVARFQHLGRYAAVGLEHCLDDVGRGSTEVIATPEPQVSQPLVFDTSDSLQRSSGSNIFERILRLQQAQETPKSSVVNYLGRIYASEKRVLEEVRRCALSANPLTPSHRPAPRLSLSLSRSLHETLFGGKQLNVATP